MTLDVHSENNPICLITAVENTLHLVNIKYR